MFTEHLKDIDGAIDSLGDKDLPHLYSILCEGASLATLRSMPNGSFAKAFGLPLWQQWLFKLVGMKN